MGLRQKQKESRREILDVSLDLFIRHGYPGTGTREISRALGIRSGQETGEIRPGNPQSLAFCFFSAIESAAENAVCFPLVPMPEVEWLVDLLKA